MFKRLSIFLLILILTASLYSQAANVKTWKVIYGQAITLKDKGLKVADMAEAATPEFEPLVISILQEQLDYVVLNKPQDKKEFDVWVYNTVQIAAKLKLTNTATYLQKLYEKTQNPRLRGECALAIGKTDAKNLIPWMNQELVILNELHRTGQLKGKEENAEGVIRALGLLKDPSSFGVLFYSSRPHYPEKIRKLALESLKTVADKPSLLVSDYIKNEKNIALILDALKYSNESASPDADKITAAKTALGTALDYLANTSDKEWENFRRDTKNLAVQSLGNLKAQDPEVITLIERKWDQDMKDTQNNLISIEALEKIATENAALLLVKKVTWLNKMTNEGGGTGITKDEGEKIMLALIKALGTIGNRVAEDELVKLTTSNQYGRTITEEAKKSLNKLK
jgi:hypothetical protein